MSSGQMKCPYRKIIIKRPEVKGPYTIKFAQDIEEFADCYEWQCFFWGDHKCHKAIADMRGGEDDYMRISRYGENNNGEAE